MFPVPKTPFPPLSPRNIIFNISKPEGKIRVYRIPEMKSEIIWFQVKDTVYPV